MQKCICWHCPCNFRCAPRIYFWSAVIHTVYIIDDLNAKYLILQMIFRYFIKLSILMIALSCLYMQKMYAISHTIKHFSTPHIQNLLLDKHLTFNHFEIIKLLYNVFVNLQLEYASLIWKPFFDICVQSFNNILRRYYKFLAFRVGRAYPPIAVSPEFLLNRFQM